MLSCQKACIYPQKDGKGIKSKQKLLTEKHADEKWILKNKIEIKIKEGNAQEAWVGLNKMMGCMTKG